MYYMYDMIGFYIFYIKYNESYGGHFLYLSFSPQKGNTFILNILILSYDSENPTSRNDLKTRSPNKYPTKHMNKIEKNLPQFESCRIRRMMAKLHFMRETPSMPMFHETFWSH